VIWWQIFARRRADLDEEIEAHLRMAVRDRVERGESLEQARAAVAKEFGNLPLVKDVTRATWGWEFLERMVQDLKYAFRRLIKSPGFTIAAAASAASALIFGLKPRDPATLVLATVLLAVVALAASYLPARRAAGLDPIASLREE